MHSYTGDKSPIGLLDVFDIVHFHRLFVTFYRLFKFCYSLPVLQPTISDLLFFVSPAANFYCFYLQQEFNDYLTLSTIKTDYKKAIQGTEFQLIFNSAKGRLNISDVSVNVTCYCAVPSRLTELLNAYNFEGTIDVTYSFIMTFRPKYQ